MMLQPIPASLAPVMSRFTLSATDTQSSGATPMSLQATL